MYLGPDLDTSGLKALLMDAEQNVIDAAQQGSQIDALQRAP